MYIKGSFSDHVGLLHRAMDVNVLRRNVIANNISNSETPNFKRSFINYESELQRALNAQNKYRLSAHTTDKRHIQFAALKDPKDVMPRQVLDYLTTSKNNGNNVNVEHEMISAMENQMLYQTLVQSISAEFSRVNIVLR